jgi:hypothetical protein
MKSIIFFLVLSLCFFVALGNDVGNADGLGVGNAGGLALGGKTLRGSSRFTPLAGGSCTGVLPVDTFKLESGTLTVKLFSPATVVAYTVYAFPNLRNTDLSWTISGSNDGSNWTTIDTGSGEKFDQFTPSDKTFQIDSPGSYLYYKAVTPISDMSSYIVKIELCE